MSIHLNLIQYGSEAYQQMLQLRTQVLLQPIGINASYIQSEQEKNDMLIGAFDNNTLVGCCVLTPRNKDVIQLRQMAVATHLQGKRMGAAIVQFAEQVAKEKGFRTMLLHARSPVVAFYQKSGYAIIGEPFEEVGIKHFRMEKTL